jgi:hypothetical protein
MPSRVSSIRKFLDVVRQLGRLDRAEAAAAGQPRHLTQAVRHARLRPLLVQPFVTGDLVDPQAAQLGDLFLDGHARQ